MKSISPTGEIGHLADSMNPFFGMLLSLPMPLGYIPLIALVILFFIIRHYDTQKKYTKKYLITSLILYIIYLYIISPKWLYWGV